MALGRRAHLNLMQYVRMATARDFRINQVALAAAVDRSEEAMRSDADDNNDEEASSESLGMSIASEHNDELEARRVNAGEQEETEAKVVPSNDNVSMLSFGSVDSEQLQSSAVLQPDVPRVARKRVSLPAAGPRSVVMPKTCVTPLTEDKSASAAMTSGQVLCNRGLRRSLGSRLQQTKKPRVE